jgi:hypothetical protein
MGSIASNLFALSHPLLLPSFQLKIIPQIVDWFSLPSPQYQLYANAGNAGH